MLIHVHIGCLEKNSSVTFAQDFDYCTEFINHSTVTPFWWFIRYFTPRGWRFFAAIDRLNKYMLTIVCEHKAVRLGLGQSGAGTGRGVVGEVEGEGRKEGEEDLLHYLLDLYLQYDDKNKSKSSKASSNTSDDDEGESSGGGTGGGGGGGGKSTFIAPTDANLRDVLINMFLAGRDTTASAINWCIYRYVRYIGYTYCILYMLYIIHIMLIYVLDRYVYYILYILYI